MLDDRQTLAIQHLAEGIETRTNIAKKVGIDRSTLYNWLNDDEFVAELDKRLLQRKTLVEKIVDSKLENMVKQLETLIQTTDNDMVRSRSLIYWIDRGLGKPTSKVELEAGIKEQPTGVDLLQDEFADFDDNV